MAVFRVERTRDYTVMCNHHLKDSNLSLKAKGLLSMMLSLPDEWNYTTRGLAAICKEGVDAIGKTLKELELAGYIIRRQLRGKDGRISDTEYTIFEKPRKPSPPDTTLPDTENPYLDNPDTEAPDTDNPAQLNTKKSNTQKSNTDRSSTHSFFLPAADGMTDGFEKKAEIREQIEYDILCQQYDRMQLDELVEIMLEVAMNRSPTVKIGRDVEYPTGFVQQRFEKITSMHIEKVMDGIRENTTRVWNTKAYVHRFNNGKRISQYTCSKYSKIPVGTLCKTQHRINESVVLELVKDLLKAIAEYAKHERAEFVRVVQEAQSSQQTAEVKKQRTRLATAKQRISELEVLLCKIYEDNILGKLSDSRYATLDAQYEKEQKELTAEISTLEKAISDYEKHEKDADRFIALIDKYENFDELTITMLNEFVEKILVHERDRKGSIQTTQEVEIYFNFVGRFVPPKFAEVELTPEELEEIRKREERKDRLHQNYLKRKASGWQRQYEDRTKAKKKAEMDAKKNALRAEDIAKGVFIPVSNMPKLEPKIAPQKGA